MADAPSVDSNVPVSQLAGSPVAEPVAMPAAIGPFRIVKPIGMGGTGIVYLGERSEHFSQRVAIKTLHPRFFMAAAEASLEHEEQVLMRLNHAHIVRVLDCGVTGRQPESDLSGTRYMVMEYVDGLAIDAYCDLHRLSLRQRVELLVQAMDAVEYAHQRLVVHADLKPAHILVSAAGQVKLLDFGVATMLVSPNLNPETGAPAPFTAAFASPEQRRGEPITVAADVYALGVVAALVLTGAAPPPTSLVAGNAGQASPLQGLMLMPPAARRAVAEARGMSASALIAELRGDIEAMLSKAIRPSPEERYPGVADFNGDMRRYLYGLPVMARTAGLGYLARKWVLRHRLAAVLAVASALLIVLSAAGVVWQAASANRQREVAETRLHELVRLTGALEGELYDSVDPLARSEVAKNQLLTSATQTLDTLAAQDSRDAVLDVELAQQYEKLAELRTAHNPRDPQAVADVLKAIAVLKNVRPPDREYSAAQKQLAEIEVLQQKLAH